MSYRLPDWQAQAQQRWNAAVWYSGRAADWAAIIAALATDTRKHDKTIEVAPAALRVGLPQTAFASEMSLLVNRGMAGNLAQSQMIAAMGLISGTAEPPGMIDLPTISANAAIPIVGTVITTTNGNWTGAPSSYTYIWTRDQVTIAAATAITYTLVSADTGGHQIRSVVSAVNATGTTQAPPSRHIQVA
jgi:hypothetical protein